MKTGGVNILFSFFLKKKTPHILNILVSQYYIYWNSFSVGKATLVYCTITRARKLIPYKNIHVKRKNSSINYNMIWSLLLKNATKRVSKFNRQYARIEVF